MDSHGIPRSQSTQEQTPEAREKEQQQIAKYRALVDRANEQIQRKEYTHEALNLTSDVLVKNPEYYTIWNYRRQILLHILDESGGEPIPEQNHALLAQDLAFLLPPLKQYPKCYWIWNHRRWLLEQQSARSSRELACKAWQDELNLVSVMLTRDRRNFHGWGYRSKVAERLRQLKENKDSRPDKEDVILMNTEKDNTVSVVESELQYTTKMIKADLSNFSAWHARSKLIPRVLQERDASPADRRIFFDTELDFLKEALLMDPYDQSLWKYHQYLMFVLLTPPATAGAGSEIWISFSNHDRQVILAKEIADFKELLDDTQDCKWLYQNLLQYAAHYLESGGGTQAFTTGEMRDWLLQLQKLDPLRRVRWAHMQQDLGL